MSKRCPNSEGVNHFAAMEARGCVHIAKNLQEPNPAEVSQPEDSEATQQKQIGTQNEDTKKREAAGETSDADAPTQPYKKLKTEEGELPDELPKVERSERWRGDTSAMFSCILCEYYTPDESEIMKHFDSPRHNEILKYLFLFNSKQRVDFLQEYLLFKKTQMKLKICKLQPINDTFSGIGQEDYIHRVQAAYCEACDVLIPDVPEALTSHKASLEHLRQCRGRFKKIMTDSRLIAANVFEDDIIMELLKQYIVGQNPFKDVGVCFDEKILVTQEDDDDDTNDEDAVAGAKVDPEVPANNNKVADVANNPKKKKKRRRNRRKGSPRILKARIPEQLNPPDASQPSTSQELASPTPTPHQTEMETAELTPEKPEVVKKDGWRAHLHRMYTCNLCQFRTQDDELIDYHFGSGLHREILRHLCNFFAKDTVDFLHGYLLFKMRELNMEQKYQKHPWTVKNIRGLTHLDLIHRVSLLHCQTCDVLIPEVRRRITLHVKSDTHIQNREGTFRNIKRNSPAVAKKLFQSKIICQMLKEYKMGQNPFMDTVVSSEQVSGTDEDIAAEEDDEDATTDDEDRPERPVANDEIPAHDTKDSDTQMFLPNEPELIETAISSTAISNGGAAKNEEAAEAP